MTEPTITILSFEPLQMQLPLASAAFAIVVVRLPPVHLKLFDLSLGGIIPDDPHVGTELPMTDIVITLQEPVALGKIVDMIATSVDRWREIWQATQRFADDYGPIPCGTYQYSSKGDTHVPTDAQDCYR